MPERILSTIYVKHLPKLEAEETVRLQNALLSTNGRQLDDADVKVQNRRLNEAIEGRRTRQRTPRITPGLAARLGMQIKSGDGEEVNEKA